MSVFLPFYALLLSLTAMIFFSKDLHIFENDRNNTI